MDTGLLDVLCGGAAAAGSSVVLLAVGLYRRWERHRTPPAVQPTTSVQPCTDAPAWGTWAAALERVPPAVRADFLPAWTTGARHGHALGGNLVQWCTSTHPEEPSNYVPPEQLRYTAPAHVVDARTNPEVPSAALQQQLAEDRRAAWGNAGLLLVPDAVHPPAAGQDHLLDALRAALAQPVDDTGSSSCLLPPVVRAPVHPRNRWARAFQPAPEPERK